MANHQRRRAIASLGEPETQARVNAAANRIVGELFAAGQVTDPPHPVESDSDSEFAEELIHHELALIADGEDPLRVSLHIAVLRTARDALREYDAIRALPETLPCATPDVPFM